MSHIPFVEEQALSNYVLYSRLTKCNTNCLYYFYNNLAHFIVK